jgi:hypothetical protein
MRQSRRRAPISQAAGATPGSDRPRPLHDLVRAGKAQQVHLYRLSSRTRDDGDWRLLSRPLPPPTRERILLGTDSTPKNYAGAVRGLYSTTKVVAK